MIPRESNGGRFEGWDRYECAVNTVWQDFPVWGRCLYDTATAAAAVLSVVERTHPRIVSPAGGRRPSGRYQGVTGFQGLAAAPDPLEHTAPLIELTGCSAADARRALKHAGRGRVTGAVLEDLLLGTSEAVTNALQYGDPRPRCASGPGPAAS